MVLREWEFYGPADRRGRLTHYRQALAEDDNGKVEKYRIGDCATMTGFDGAVWVGIITDFYDDSSPHIGESRRAVLRWFYALRHIHDETRVKQDVPPMHDDNELYFSDDTDYGDNPITVITSKVKVFQNLNDYENACEQGVDCYLVRGFYRPTPVHSPVLRLLETGELQFLLDHPSNDKMYESYAKACRIRRLNSERREATQRTRKGQRQIPMKRYPTASRQLASGSRYHREINLSRVSKGNNENKSRIHGPNYDNRPYRRC